MMMSASHERGMRTITIEPGCAERWTADSGAGPSMRVLETAALFGLPVDDAAQQRPAPWRASFDLRLPPRGIVLVSGPSGSGKSTILRAVRCACAAASIDTLAFTPGAAIPDRALVDLFPDRSLDDALRLLSLAGLSEARLMLRTPGALSDGQRDRLHLALLFARADSLAAPAALIADEFGARLDRVTAQIIAGQVRRWLHHAAQAHTFIAATAHDDLHESLETTEHIVTDLDAPVRRLDNRCATGKRSPRSVTVIEQDNHIQFEPGTPRLLRRKAERGQDARATGSRAAPLHRTAALSLICEPGTIDDYDSLARFHYRGERPATIERIMRARDRATGRIIGVLVLSQPRLSCRGRDIATAGRYSNLSRGQAARLINREVRTISRVIVHPQWRGCGAAVGLVRCALSAATTCITEAIAAMGRANPFFERAGMRAIDVPATRSSARLRDAFGHVNIDRYVPASPGRLRAAAESLSSVERAWFARECRRWLGRQSGFARGVAQMPLPALLARIPPDVFITPRYYIHVRARERRRERL